jgi:hypothetical protein
MIAGSSEEAIVAADGLIDAAEATGNPWVLSYALLAYGMAYRDADPGHALEALRRGIAITRDSGNRFNESHLAHIPSGLEAKHGDPLAALEYIALAIRHYQDAGSVAFIDPPSLASQHFSTGSDASNPRPPSPASQHSVRSLPRRSLRPPPRSPTSAMSSATHLRIARPQGRDHDHRRHGYLCIRPNRPGPNRVERRPEIDLTFAPVLTGPASARCPWATVARS